MLKLKCWRIENVVLMKVLEQDENFRTNIMWIDKETGMEIRSVYQPKLFDDIIYIQGEKEEKDNDVVAFECSSQENALDLLKKISIAVKNFNKEYKTNMSTEYNIIEVSEYIFE